MQTVSRLPDEGGSAEPLGNRGPWSDRVCDVLSLGLALWTLCSWATIAAGGTLSDLMILFALAGGAVLLLARASARRASWALSFASPPWPTDRADFLALRGVALLGVLAALTAFGLSGNIVLFWWCAVVLLGVAWLAILARQEPVLPRPVGGRRRQGVLLVLALACGIFALVAHRPDYDDAFYIGLAVKAVDDPAWALLSHDPLHGDDQLRLHLPVYRLHSYELLNAALAKLTGIPAIYCFHWIAAFLGAFLVPLANARLLKQLVPRAWLGTLFALLVILVAVGETHRWYGNFSLVRIWQGKGIYLSIFLPLIYAYALEVGRRPSWRGFTLLAAAQIAAVGCTSSALWGAPASALVALACTFRPSRRGWLAVGWGALASTFVIAAGWILKQQMEPTSRILERTSTAPGEELAKALHIVLGDGRLLFFALGSVLLAWILTPRCGLARRFAVAVPLAVLAVLLNPYGADWLKSHVVGPSYWRSLWILPTPTLIALILSSPLHLSRAPRARYVAYALALIVFAGGVPRYSATSPVNDVSLGWPRLKVPEDDYRAAETISRALDPRTVVLAPPELSLWLPTLHRGVTPLIVRQYPRFEHSEVRQRLLMARMVDGRWPLSKKARAAFIEGLREFEVGAVCLDKASRRAPRIQNLLQEAHFEPRTLNPRYEIWTPSRDSG